ncbi:MAG: FHIPEP family type III secretion protein [Pyrinomonadaceae bacterium]
MLVLIAEAAAGGHRARWRPLRGARQRAAARAPDADHHASEDDLQPTFAVPLAVVVGKELSALVAQESIGRALSPSCRASLRHYDLGVMLPHVFVSGDAPLRPINTIAIKEVPWRTIKPDCLYVNDSAENISVFGIEGESARNPADLQPGAWIPRDQRSLATQAGLVVWEPAEVMTLHLSHVMRRYAHEFIGLQEAQGYLDFVARGAPKLVEEVIGKIVTINQFTDVLQRLVQEGISIRDIKSILDALAEWGRVEKDSVLLTEYVRSAMKRYISFRHTQSRDTLFVHLLDPEIEDVMRGAIRRTATNSFLALDPLIAHDILAALRREMSNLPASAQQPVIVTDLDLRRFVRKMVELEFPTLSVLSYQELAPELNIQPISRISMRPPPQEVADATQSLRVNA